MSEYFPKPFRSRENIKIKVDLSNYATKADIKNITHVDTSNFTLKTNLANLKTEVDKLDIDKLVPIPADLSKLSDVVKSEVANKVDYDKLVAKVDNIDTSDFVLKTNCNTKITELENKIPDFSNLVKKTDFNTKITEIKNKLNNHNHNKYIDPSKFNTLATNLFNTRTAQANLISKTDFDAKLSSLNRKITKSKSDHLLVQNELKKLKKFDSSYFCGKNCFDENGTLNYYVFQPLFKYLEVAHVGNITHILSWKV